MLAGADIFSFLTDGFDAIIQWFGNLADGIGWLLSHFAHWVFAGITFAANAFFLACHDFLVVVFGLLPSMSSAPLISGGTWTGWLNWFLPVGEALTGFAALLTAYL